MKKERNRPALTVCLNPKIIEKLEEGNYNTSKLVDKLLTKHFEKKSIKN